MITRKVPTIILLLLGTLLLCGNAAAIGEATTASSDVTTKQYPAATPASYESTCKCRTLPPSSGSKCFVFVNSVSGVCRARRCKPSYVCDNGRGTKICRWKVYKTTIVKDGSNTCKVIKQVSKKLEPIGQAPTYKPTPTYRPTPTTKPTRTPTPTRTPKPTVTYKPAPTTKPTSSPTYSLLGMSRTGSSTVTSGSAKAVTVRPHYTQGFSTARCLRTSATQNPYWTGYFSRAMAVYRVYLTPSKAQFAQMKTVSIYAGGSKCRLLTSLVKPTTRVVFQCTQQAASYIQIRGSGKTLEFCGVDVYGRVYQPTVKPTPSTTYSLLGMSRTASSTVTSGSAKAVTVRPHYTQGFSTARCLRTYATQNPYWTGYFTRAMAIYRVYLTPSKAQFAQMKTVSVYAGGSKCRLLTSLAKPTMRVVFQCTQQAASYIQVRGSGKTLEFCGVDVYGRVYQPTVKPTPSTAYSLLGMSRTGSSTVTSGSAKAVTVRPHYTQGFSTARCLRTYATQNPYWTGYFSRAMALYRVYLTPSKAQFTQMKTVSIYAGGSKCRLLTSLVKPTTRVVFQCTQQAASYIQVRGSGKTLEFCGVDVYGRVYQPTVKPTPSTTYSLLGMSRTGSSTVTSGSAKAVTVRPHYTQGFSTARCLRTYATQNPYWTGYFSRAMAIYRVYLTPSKAQFAQMKTVSVYAGGSKCRLLTSLVRPTTRVIFQCTQQAASYIQVRGSGKTLEFCGVDVYGRVYQPTVKPTPSTAYSLLGMSRTGSSTVTSGSAKAVTVRPHYTQGFSTARCLRTYATQNPYWTGYFSRAMAIYRVDLTPSKAQFAQMKTVSVYAGGSRCKLLTSLARPTTRVTFQCTQQAASHIQVRGSGKSLEFCGVDIYGRVYQPGTTAVVTARPVATVIPIATGGSQSYDIQKMDMLKWGAARWVGSPQSQAMAVTYHPHQVSGYNSARCIKTVTKGGWWLGEIGVNGKIPPQIKLVVLTNYRGADWKSMSYVKVYAGSKNCRRVTTVTASTSRVYFDCDDAPAGSIRVVADSKYTLVFCGIDVFSQQSTAQQAVKPAVAPTAAAGSLQKLQSFSFTN